MPPPVPLKSPHDLVLFVSCVDGKPVSRLPLPGKPGDRTPIGARRVEAGRGYVYDEAEVVGITRAEVDAHGKVYERTIHEGNLRRRSREEWVAWRAAQKAADVAAKTGKQQRQATAEEGGSAPAPGSTGVARVERVPEPAAPAGGIRS